MAMAILAKENIQLGLANRFRRLVKNVMAGHTGSCLATLEMKVELLATLGRRQRAAQLAYL